MDLWIPKQTEKSTADFERINTNAKWKPIELQTSCPMTLPTNWTVYSIFGQNLTIF